MRLKINNKLNIDNKEDEKVKNTQRLDKRFLSNIIYVFLLLQPMIDILTSLMVRFVPNSLSIGSIIRATAMIMMFIYLLFTLNLKNNKKDRLKLLFLLILGLFSVLFLINRFFEVGVRVKSEVSNLLKFNYPIIGLFFFVDVIEKKVVSKEKIINILLVNLLIISSVLSLSFFTKTNFLSYEATGKGNVGWFYAANDLGVIVILLVSLFLDRINKKTRYAFLYVFLSVILIGIGTKLVIYGLLLIITLTLFYYLIFKIKDYIKIVVTILLLLIQLFTILSFSQIHNNRLGTLSDFMKQRIDVEGLDKNQEGLREKELAELAFGGENQKALKMINYILSNRLVTLLNTREKFYEASINNRMLGMGHINRDENIEFKDIEMDLFSLIYRYGIFGLIIYISIFIYILRKIFLNIFKDIIQKKLTFYTFSLFMAIMIALSTGAIMGHVYFTPSVSIYLSIFLALLVNDKKLSESDKETIILAENKRKNENKKSIGIVTLHLSFGGIEQATASLANALKDDYNVTIINLYKTEYAFNIDQKIKIVQLTNLYPNKKEFKSAIKIKNIFKIIKEGCKSAWILYKRKYAVQDYLEINKYDYIISTRYIFNNVIRKSDSKKKIAIEHKHHNNNKKYINKLVKSTKGLDTFVSVSSELNDFYTELMKTKCVFIPNFIESYPKTLNENKEKRMVAVGRLSKEKGFIDLIEVFNLVHKENKEWKLDLVGDGEEKDIIIEKIKKYNLEKYINVHGFLNKSELNKIYSVASLYIMTSFEESFGIVVVEAASYGIPTISFSTAKGVLEIIDTTTGVIIEDRKIANMKDEIIKIINDTERLKELSQNSYIMAKKYTLDNVKIKWLDLLKELEN